jgi:hypothetical protein
MARVNREKGCCDDGPEFEGNISRNKEVVVALSCYPKL